LAIHINILKFDLVACTAILKLAPRGMERWYVQTECII